MRIGVTIPAMWPVKLMIPPVVPIIVRGATSAMIDHVGRHSLREERKCQQREGEGGAGT